MGEWPGYVHRVEVQKRAGSPGAGVTWEPNSGSLKWGKTIVTIEPSVQPRPLCTLVCEQQAIIKLLELESQSLGQ